MLKLMILGLLSLCFATAIAFGQPAADETITLTGYFPSENIEDSFVKTASGAITGVCKSDHHSGYEGFALNFNCIGAQGRFQGRASAKFVGDDDEREFVYELAPTLNYFEGASRWVDLGYQCKKKNLETFRCSPTGKNGGKPSDFKNQFNFSVVELGDLNFYLQKSKEVIPDELIPCIVTSRAESLLASKKGVSLKCYSYEGVFVGQTAPTGQTNWDLEGEMSFFYGPGNYIKMKTVCTPDSSTAEIPGNGSLVKTRAKCPNLP